MRTGGRRAAAAVGLRDVLESGTTAGLDESQLLERYRLGGDARAFEAIVGRHGPMVLGVCRRRLGDPGDVEDAFQATFLILVRKAGGLRDPSNLAAWLHGVAHRVAVRASRRRSTLRGRERDTAAAVAVDPFDPAADPDIDVADLRAVLDEELGRLASRDRAPLVLCYLEGRTHDEAAARLGWPVGTVRSRLSRARERLRRRLIRRGLSPSLAVLGRAFDTLALRPEVTLSLLRSTLNAAPAAAAGLLTTTAAAVSGPAASLADGVITTMWLSKLAVFSGIAFGAVALGGGTAILARQEPGKPAQPGTPAATTPAVPAAVAQPVEDRPRRSVARPDDATASQQRDVSPTELIVLRNKAQRALANAERLVARGEVSRVDYGNYREDVRLAEARITDEVERLKDAVAILLIERRVLEAEVEAMRVKTRLEEIRYKNQQESLNRPAKVTDIANAEERLSAAQAVWAARKGDLEINILKTKQLESMEHRLTVGLAMPDAPPPAELTLPAPPAPPAAVAPPAPPASLGP